MEQNKIDKTLPTKTINSLNADPTGDVAAWDECAEFNNFWNQCGPKWKKAGKKIAETWFRFGTIAYRDALREYEKKHK